MTTDRLETFSDGVFAIAITLLILELDVPTDTHGHLWQALLEEWPGYLAYLISFTVIGIIWVNHHAIMNLLATVDRPLMFLNLFLLLTVAAIPFPTALVAEHITDPSIDSKVAAAVYGGLACFVAISFNLLYRWMVRDARLIHPHLDLRELRANTKRFSLGVLIYPITVGLAFVSPIWALAVHGFVAVYYVVDQVAISDQSASLGES